MNLLHIVGFGLKVGHLLLMLCCWFLSLISLNWLSNGKIMTTKNSLLGDGWKIWMKLWDQLPGRGSKIHHQHSQHTPSASGEEKKNWWTKLLIAWIVFGFIISLSVFWYMSSQAVEKRKEMLTSMCDERARMLQDQFNVSMNHIQAMSVIISIFHHAKNPSAIDQRTFARYTDKTSFERPLTSGVAYAVRVLHDEREQFEIQQGWTIKRMDKDEQTPVHEDEYHPEDLEPSPVQKEYAPVIFAQETVAHVISLDMLSGKEDRDNILRARESGKGVLTAPFRLLKTNRLGVILTFAVYKRDLPPNATPAERTQASAGYLGGIFDIESLVEKLLQQLASKHTILVNVYDTTNSSLPISMYGSNASFDGLFRVSALNFGDPFRKHEMHCRFKQKPPWPWVAITTSVFILIITLLAAQIFHATLNRIAKVTEDCQKMALLKQQAEAADTAKSNFLATVSHEIRTPVNGFLGMLQMLMDTHLDDTQQDYVRVAGESGKTLVSIINAVLDQAKIESGKLELQEVNFNLRGIVDDVLSLFSGKSQDKKVELAAYVSSKVPDMLFGDPGRFKQIITNLVGNSMKFTDKGHIFVTVHLVEEVAEMEGDRDPTSSLSGLSVVDRRQSWANFQIFEETSAMVSLADQVNIIVSVEDTGQGIPHEAQDRVFKPFVQVVPSITRTHGGTGIGLSISTCLVHLMRGEIGLCSSPDVGSTFTFTAVFTNGSSESNGEIPDHPSTTISSEFRGMKALVVDPNPVRAKVSRYHIERLGIHVEVVSHLSLVFSGSTPINMVFVEEDVWVKQLDMLVVLYNKLKKDCGVSPKTLLLSNSSSYNRPGFSASDDPTLFVVTKPLRANMLAASLRRVMGIRSRRNGELHSSTLSGLLHGRKVLVVDDNPVNLRVAAGALKKYGAEVVNAERGKYAISLLTPPHTFDACFMDIQMPEMDGFEATRIIRRTEAAINEGLRSGELSMEDYNNVSNWHVPILAMTADVIQATSEKCLKSDMDGYVSKPFEAEQLYREISRFLQTAPDEHP